MATLTLRLIKGSTLTFSETDNNFTALNNEKIERDGSIPFTGAQPFVAGTVSAPGITIVGDTNTGVYSPAADQLAITCGGTQRGLFSSSGLTVTGTISGTLSGDGSAITNLNASNISSGTLSDARLSSNVPLKNAANTFTASQSITGSSGIALTVSGVATQYAASFNGGTAGSGNLSGIDVYGSTNGYIVSSFRNTHASGFTAIEVHGANGASSAFVAAHPTKAVFGSNTNTPTEIWTNNTPRVAVSQNGNVTIAAPVSGTALAANGRALTTPVNVAFSATPTFDSSQSNTIYFGTMTANVTSMTITNAVDGAQLQIRFVQDATGGRTVTLPSNVQVSGSLNTAANAVTWLVLTYVSSASRWEGTWTRVS
jgi:hypothetical protein